MMSQVASPVIGDFFAASSAFFEWLKTTVDEPGDRVLGALLHLSRVYHLGLLLPMVAFDESAAIEDAEVRVQSIVEGARGDFPFDYYGEVLDPLKLVAEEADFALGSLYDDMRDILHDIAGGMAAYEAGHHTQACFLWRQMFYAHWGLHAVSAMGVLHRWLQNEGWSGLKING